MVVHDCNRLNAHPHPVLTNRKYNRIVFKWASSSALERWESCTTNHCFVSMMKFGEYNCLKIDISTMSFNLRYTWPISLISITPGVWPDILLSFFRWELRDFCHSWIRHRESLIFLSLRGVLLPSIHIAGYIGVLLHALTNWHWVSPPNSKFTHTSLY